MMNIGLSCPFCYKKMRQWLQGGRGACSRFVCDWVLAGHTPYRHTSRSQLAKMQLRGPLPQEISQAENIRPLENTFAPSPGTKSTLSTWPRKHIGTLSTWPETANPSLTEESKKMERTIQDDDLSGSVLNTNRIYFLKNPKSIAQTEPSIINYSRRSQVYLGSTYNVQYLIPHKHFNEVHYRCTGEFCITVVWSTLTQYFQHKKSKIPSKQISQSEPQSTVLQKINFQAIQCKFHSLFCSNAHVVQKHPNPHVMVCTFP